jgi:lipopolysaccharide transport system ATP-binding protein
MSSNEIAIKVENLSKCYQIYDRPNDRLKQFVLPRLQRLLGRKPKQYFRGFWALKEVSFEVKKGETVGIIGRNGSGKSTLLQLICGTLNPTSGSVQTNGRIAALLELGSGFNPEFTGRENIYLNASVLGLSKKEIDDRFDQIVAFADVGDFIEQPVKTYSSGMVVRVAFAVIAHVDADILVIDEALAVGDAVFQQKCMRFIRNFQGNGTLLFVSHDTASVQNLCKSGIWLKHGKIEEVGTAKSVSEAYLQFTLQEIYGEEAKLTSMRPTAIGDETNIKESTSDAETTLAIDYGAVASVRENIDSAKGWKTGQADIVSIALKRLSTGQEDIFEGGEKVRMIINALAHQELNNPILGFMVKDRLGQDIFGENTLPFTTNTPILVKAGQKFIAEFDFRLPMLPNGQYAVTAGLADGDLFDHIQHNYLHDVYIINVSSSKVRWGLVGLPFEKVSLKVIHD